jgi:DNA replication protein DnaC
LLVLCGDTGTGKTHAARAISRYCTMASMTAFEGGKWGARRIPSTAFVPWPEAANQFGDKNFSAMDDCCGNDLVTLDDVGAENDPWKVCADKLCQILSRRENRFTVLTTNIAIEAWPTVFDTRISDRLVRNSKVVDMAGVPSYAARVRGK